jgi:3-oxoacyl-[acyl-carrier-protein] synthase-3
MSSNNEVYIIRTAKFLPNGPIGNEEMEEYLGLINGKPSKSRRIVLRNNGIRQRYYAITKQGQHTHTNYEMTALAVKELFSNDPEEIKNIDLLCCGTSTPDQMMPSHAVMVHGELKASHPIEVVSPSGVCCSGMHALKYAWMAIRNGDARTAVTSGSERLSAIMRGTNYDHEVQKLAELEQNPYISFEKDFLRWMLSDGAAAFLLSNEKNVEGLSLRVDWLEGVSYANEIEVCMCMAAEKQADGSIKSYMDHTPDEIVNGSVLSIKQDVKLLSEHIVSFGYDKLKTICDKRGLKIDEIDYFLPHLSSEFFRGKIAEKLEENGLNIPQEKWFTNLTTTGNVGAGSIYLIVDELFKSNKLKKGDKLLLVVPESARFSYVFGQLTVV